MANSIMSLSIPVGFMLAYCLGTLIVTSASQAQFLQLTTLYSVITLIGTFMVTVFFKYPHGTVVKNGHFLSKRNAKNRDFSVKKCPKWAVLEVFNVLGVKNKKNH